MPDDPRRESAKRVRPAPHRSARQNEPRTAMRYFMPSTFSLIPVELEEELATLSSKCLIFSGCNRETVVQHIQAKLNGCIIYVRGYNVIDLP